MPKPRRALPPQHQSLIFLLESCTSIRTALQIQSQLLVSGLHRQRLFLSKLISFFSLKPPANPPSVSHSLLIFSRLRRPNVFIFNTLIRAHSRSGRPLASLELYRSMLSAGRPRPNQYTFTFLLASCAETSLANGAGPGQQAHCHAVKAGFVSDVHVGNSLVWFYSCLGDLASARQAFDEITQLDVVSFNVMMNGYGRGGRPDDGLRVFRDMVGSGVEPDRRSFVCLMSIFSALGDLRKGRAVHVLALKGAGFDDAAGDRLKLGLVDMYAKLGAMEMADRVFGAMSGKKSTAAWSCMVSGHAKRGEVNVALKMFDEMPEKDLIAWTAMISGYSQNGHYKEALELFEEMEDGGIKPDEVTLVAVLSACAHLGKLELGKRIHCYIEDCFPSHGNSRLYTAIIDMYAKCFSIGTALEVFDRVNKRLKTRSMFNSVICGLAHHGLAERAVDVFREMEALALSPDEVTFVGVLCACSHSGLIEEGMEVFDSMVKKHGIRPQIEHFGCMVDLLGREGRLDEAYDLIKGMPVSPNSVIWSSLLLGCRVHGNIRLGQIARRKLLQLSSNEPSCKATDSRLSEMFSDATSPENANKVRKMLNYKAVWKKRPRNHIPSDGMVLYGVKMPEMTRGLRRIA